MFVLKKAEREVVLESTVEEAQEEVRGWWKVELEKAEEFWRGERRLISARGQIGFRGRN